jgi:hypothetical protein
MERTMEPVMCSMSRLPITSHAAVMAATAAADTSFFVSFIDAVTCEIEKRTKKVDEKGNG